MMISSNAFRFVLLLATVCNILTSVTPAADLGDAGDYVILTKSGISTVPDYVITRKIGVSPIAATALTGFSLTLDPGGQFSTSIQLHSPPGGKVYAANYSPPTPAILSTAVSNMETAYTDAAGRLNPDPERINLGGGVLGGVFGGEAYPLTPGVYTFGSGVSIEQHITFECTNKTDDDQDPDVFIIQMTGNLIQAASTKVFLTEGALAENIFWQVAGFVEVGVGAEMQGIILGFTSVVFKTGSSLACDQPRPLADGLHPRSCNYHRPLSECDKRKHGPGNIIGKLNKLVK
jgi:hypothetical protein